MTFKLDKYLILESMAKVGVAAAGLGGLALLHNKLKAMSDEQIAHPETENAITKAVNATTGSGMYDHNQALQDAASSLGH